MVKGSFQKMDVMHQFSTPIFNSSSLDAFLSTQRGLISNLTSFFIPEILIISTHTAILFDEQKQEILLQNMALHIQSTIFKTEMNKLNVNSQIIPLKWEMECLDGSIVVCNGIITSLFSIKKNNTINSKIQYFCSLIHTIIINHTY